MTTLQEYVKGLPLIAYKRDSKGDLRIWAAHATDDGDLVQIHGKAESENFQETRKFRPGKYAGKANETTPAEQAWLEAQSAHKKKLDKDYFATIEETEGLNILPMLAQSYEKRADKIDWTRPHYAQPKLDGMRCLCIIHPDGTIELKSRAGHDLVAKGYAVGHIIESIRAGFDIEDLTQIEVLDGELYSHELTFQENMSAIKKAKETSELVKLWIYDRFAIVNDEVVIEDFAARFLWLTDVASGAGHDFVETVEIRSEAELKTLEADHVKRDFEGTMLRTGDCLYKLGGRSNELLKCKSFIDIAVRCIDIEPQDSKPTHGTPVLQMDDGQIFRAGLRMSHEERQYLLTNADEFIGQTAEVRFFEWTDEGLPRFPVVVGWRLDK